MIVNDIRKSKYERQLRELEPYTISTVDPNDELEWMNRGMYELLKFMYDNEQYMDVVDETKIQIVPRVIKVNNYLSPSSLDIYKVPYVTFSGIYCLVNVIYIPKVLFKKLVRGHSSNWIFSPESYSLPSERDAKYHTMKEANAGKFYTVIAGDSISAPVADMISSIDNYSVIY